MNDKNQETRVPRAPLILTVPAYSFVVALHLDCGWSKAPALSAETFAQEVEPVDPVRDSLPESDSSHNPGRPTTSWASLHADPGFEYHYRACKKGDPKAKAVTAEQKPGGGSGERQ